MIEEIGLTGQPELIDEVSLLRRDGYVLSVESLYRVNSITGLKNNTMNKYLEGFSAMIDCLSSGNVKCPHCGNTKVYFTDDKETFLNKKNHLCVCASTWIQGKNGRIPVGKGCHKEFEYINQ